MNGEVHILTIHEGYDTGRVIGVYADLSDAFDALEEEHDRITDEYPDHQIDALTAGDRRGFVYSTGDYDDCIELLLFSRALPGCSSRTTAKKGDAVMTTKTDVDPEVEQASAASAKRGPA